MLPSFLRRGSRGHCLLAALHIDGSGGVLEKVLRVLPTGPYPGGGVSQKSDTVGDFEPPPPFLKMVRGGVLRVFLDAHTSFVRFFFWCCSFGLHI